MKSIRKYWDFVWYTIFVLWDTKRRVEFLISFAFLLAGIWMVPREKQAGMWIMSLSVGAVLWSIRDMIGKFCGGRRFDVGKAIELPSLKPTQADELDGYEYLRIENGSHIFFSRKINQLLHNCQKSGKCINFVVDRNISRRLTSSIRGLNYAQDLLLWKIRTSSSLFFNEKKVGMATDLTGTDLDRGSFSVTLYPTWYFSYYLTIQVRQNFYNEYYKNSLRSIRFDLKSDQFVAIGGGNDAKSLQGLSRIRNTSCHIGVTVLALSKDNQLCIWIQSSESNVSARELVASGSGSLDWGDLKRQGFGSAQGDFLASLKNGVERELMEEAGLKCRDSIRDLKLLGYSRWCERGGKPEFFYVAKLNVLHCDLSPNGKEVYTHSDISETYEINDLGQLRTWIEDVLEGKKRDCEFKLSTSLNTGLLFLKHAIDDDADYISGLLKC